MRLPEVLLAPPIAHRGLWGPRGAPENSPENSSSAFERACRAGYGIELDVRLSADGDAVVFHDERLERMTGVEGVLEDMPARQLTELALLGGPDRIATLEQTLELVSGRSMLLVEIKAGQEGSERLAARTGELLERYGGPAAAGPSAMFSSSTRKCGCAISHARSKCRAASGSSPAMASRPPAISGRWAASQASAPGSKLIAAAGPP